MFLVLQHPFADLRAFLGPESGRLARPDWPGADVGSDFIRSSGLVKPRLRGGVEEWAGEELYGDASFALRFPNHLGEARLGTGTLHAVADHAFRRFHSDGTVARLEVGLRLHVEDGESGVSATEWLVLLREILEIPVRVRDTKQKNRTVKLIEAGDILAQHYLVATTNRNRTPKVKLEPWWLCSGTPALVIEYPHRHPPTLPPHSRRVLDITEADSTLSHAWLQFGKQRCSAWFVAVGRGGDPDAVRRIRIHLARLHAERQCLKLVLFHLKDASKFDLAKSPATSDAVQQYLNDALQAIAKPERFGLAQSAMIEVAREAFDIAFEGQATSLQLMRRQVAVKVEGYIRRAQNGAAVVNNIQGNLMNTTITMGNVNVTGDFNVVTATNIQSSFNKAANAEVDADLKDKLKSLAVEVASLAKKLPPEDAETASKNLETLTSEAVSKKPRKEWYELAAKGIVEAAKTVAELAAPVSAAVSAVLALLGV
ncbi:hypothetical protein R69619_00410 [Paraburkholderia nemoris]|uniref:hypothetical protein n=1 Tax=Paraburkholderia nemoris TaxID=2793076 RepID=UPI00190A790C|nr:hypothetical protein [Paraburkholderia nemoris]MBK3737673.1 hypothetical protein [Paraburkholderia aspalathi]CAE6694473.1 hypothetical protein R69619_00410 [Paraburkholderia nemoris]